jgi:uncharacterized Tic20 family protein
MSNKAPNMSSPNSRTIQVLKRRAEEQVVCAILHAISPYGFIALIATVVVWNTKRNRCRFIAFQSLQALMFQLCILLAWIAVFGVFMAGFLYAMFSGMIARTGAGEPELTNFLIGAGILGMACLFFVQFIFPFWGVWGAFQILRGRNFRYPILGKYALRWGANTQPAIETVSDKNRDNRSGANSERVLAVIGHLSILVGFSAILAPILWTTSKQRSEFLGNQLLQASIFQLIMNGMLFAMFLGIWSTGMIFGLFDPFLPPPLVNFITTVLGTPAFMPVYMGTMGLLILVMVISAIIAAVQSLRGKQFCYPITGGWLNRYLQVENILKKAGYQSN